MWPIKKKKKIQLSGFSAYPDGSSSQLIRISGALLYVESSWNVMSHGDAREGKWMWNCRMEWVASTLHTTSELGVSNITTADVHTSAASSRLNWRPRRFKWTRPFRLKTKSGFCACAIAFQTQSTYVNSMHFKTLWPGLCTSSNAGRFYSRHVSCDMGSFL